MLLLISFTNSGEGNLTLVIKDGLGGTFQFLNTVSVTGILQNRASLISNVQNSYEWLESTWTHVCQS